MQPPLPRFPDELGNYLPAVKSIRFIFDITDIEFSKKTQDLINRTINNVGKLNSTKFNNFLNQLTTINDEFLNKISTDDFELLPADFNFADQFSNINEGDILVFESYYDDFTELYRGPTFYVIGEYDRKEVIRFYRLGDELDDPYVLPSEALSILAENGAATLEGVRDLYPEVDIEAIYISGKMNYKVIDPDTGRQRKLSGMYYLGTTNDSSNIITVDGNIIYLGEKIIPSRY